MQRTPSDRSYTRYNCNRSVWFRKALLDKALLDNGILYLVKSCFDKNTGKKTIEKKVRKQLRIKDEKVTKKAKLIWRGIWGQTNDENCHPTLTQVSSPARSTCTCTLGSTVYHATRFSTGQGGERAQVSLSQNVQVACTEKR